MTDEMCPPAGESGMDAPIADLGLDRGTHIAFAWWKRIRWSYPRAGRRADARHRCVTKMSRWAAEGTRRGNRAETGCGCGCAGR